MSAFIAPSRNLPNEIKSMLDLMQHHLHNAPTAAETGPAVQTVEVFRDYVKAQYQKWFPKAKPYTVAVIATHVFKMSWKDEKDRIKYELAGLLHSTDSTLSDLKQLVGPSCKGTNCLDRAKNIIGLLGSYAMNAVDILQRGDAAIDNEPRPYGFGMANVVSSPEVFRSSESMLREFTWGKMEAQAAAVFILRQSIELRVKFALGIGELYDDRTGAPMIVAISKLINFVKARPADVSFPVDWKTVEEVNKWSNKTVHGGWVPPAWQIALAQEVIAPIFDWATNGTSRSKFGAVRVTKSFLAGLETTLQDYLRLTDNKVQKQIAEGTHVRPDVYDHLKIMGARLESVAVDTLP